MSNELAISNVAQAAVVTFEEYLESKRDFILRTLAKDATPDEFELFMYQCARTQLDPLSRQIYAISRWSNQEKRKVMSIQVSIDGFRLVADRTGHYVPGRDSSYETDLDGRLVSATAYVKKWALGQWHEISATAFYDEYVQLKDGKPTQMWAEKPRIMLSKCAESLALRKAFPNDLSGLYTLDEMGTPPEQAAPPQIRTIEASTVEIIDPPSKRADPHRHELVAKMEKHFDALELSKPARTALAAALGRTPKMSTVKLAVLYERVLAVKTQGEAREIVRAHKKETEAGETTIVTEDDDQFAQRIEAGVQA